MKTIPKISARLLVLLLSASMLLTVCSSGSASSVATSGLPIVNQPVTLKIMTMRWGDMGDSFKENQWLVDLEKTTGVTIEWTVVSNTDWPEQKSILLASNELPDIFFGNQTIKDADIAANPTLFMELTDLIDEYMPNYQHAMEVIPAIKSTTTSPDGKIYSFGKILPARPQAAYQPIINKTWLDKLGLSAPTTIDEFEKVLIAFKNDDPNGNGLQDEIPMSFSGDIQIDLLSPFGITDMYNTGFCSTGGDLFFYPTSQNYKDAIKWVHKLWDEGVMDQESFTQDSARLTAKKANDSIPLVGASFQWTPDAGFGKWSEQYIAIAPMKGPDGKQYAEGNKDGVFSVQRNEALITTQCKTPEVAARWIDQFYDNEASIQNFWGAIGTVITKNSDGTYTLNDPPAGTSADAWYWDQSLRDFGPKFIDPSFNSKIKLNPAAGDGFKLEISKLADPYVTTPFPDVIYTTDENDQLTTLTADINSYIKQMRAVWITKGGIDEDWDAYIQKLKDMGLDTFIQIHMDALARVNAE